MDIAVLKACARIEADSLTDGVKLVLEQHSSAFKWLNASLLAVNGGGAIAVLAAANLSNSTKLYACTGFFFGILFALLSARLSQSTAIRAVLPFKNQIFYWTRVSITGEQYTDREAELRQEAVKAQRWAFIGQACGWLSATAFMTGAISIALGLSYSGMGV